MMENNKNWKGVNSFQTDFFRKFLEMGFENIQDFMFRFVTGHAFSWLAILNQQQGRYTHDIKLDSDVLIAVNIHMDHFDFALQLLS